MKRRWAILALAMISCPDRAPGGAGDVFRLRVMCGEPCTALADGRATTAVELCTATDDPHPGTLMATLTLSRGAWENPPDPTKPLVYTAALPGASCIEANLISPGDLAPVFIDAQLGGYTHRACVQMRAPPIDSVFVTTDPISLAGSAPTPIAVKATLHSATGASVPAATVVAFGARLTPDGVFALQPLSAPLDTSGAASTRLITPPGTVTATITAAASTPDGPPCPGNVDPSVDAGVPPMDPATDAGASATGAVTLVVLPDAGVPDAAPDAAIPDAGAPDAAIPDAAMAR